MARLAALLALVVGMVVGTPSAQAERRVALVVGNAAYRHAPALANAANDAKAIATALERLGFEVVAAVDLGNAGLRRALDGFAGKVSGADVALFFYAGHGLQLSGENYLIPVDAAIRVEADLAAQAVKLDAVSRQMSRDARVKIVWLDASRNNPFEKQLAGSLGARRSGALKKGLDVGGNVANLLVTFATDPGEVALDGEGPHSPFTSALLRHIEEPGLEIGQMMRRVTREVFAATQEKQRPWTNASLTSEFYFKR